MRSLVTGTRSDSVNHETILEVVGAVVLVQASTYSSDSSDSSSDDSSHSDLGSRAPMPPFSQLRMQQQQQQNSQAGTSVNKSAIAEIILKAMIADASVRGLQKRVEDRVDTVKLLEARDWIESLGTVNGVGAIPFILSQGALVSQYNGSAEIKTNQIGAQSPQVPMVMQPILVGQSEVVARPQIVSPQVSLPVASQQGLQIGHQGQPTLVWKHQLVQQPTVTQQMVQQPIIMNAQPVSGAIVRDINSFLRQSLKESVAAGYIQKAQTDLDVTKARLDGEKDGLKTLIL
eukprot:Blabericola_migrator_1__7166@NODE_3635_length_1618_cov_29_412637_g2254_i0_p1_GENE_NODE_3635_length_1618_cov_29_412637_g2254_i0NODE_3635_length_1618_cov_29_412637_g2254_i0_p1_ORF_typecomplete_len288_score68_40_NODE_3635_length_1618_cov_29_412637_g2254_i06041467